MISLPCKKPELYDYSVHKGRMLLIDQIEGYDFSSVELTSLIEIHRESEFLHKDSMPVWVSFEYMAQSIALLSTLIHKDSNEEPQIGFIMNVRDFKALRPRFALGDRVMVRVKQTFKEGGIAVFDGETFVNGECYSRGVVTVIEKSQELLTKWNEDFGG
jgi:predicted hotdog family 3-hydroxylacyl-ACP dehydratase